MNIETFITGNKRREKNEHRDLKEEIIIKCNCGGMPQLSNITESHLVRKHPKVNPAFVQSINLVDFQIGHPDLTTGKAEAVCKPLKDTLKAFDDLKTRKEVYEV